MAAAVNQMVCLVGVDICGCELDLSSYNILRHRDHAADLSDYLFDRFSRVELQRLARHNKVSKKILTGTGFRTKRGLSNGLYNHFRMITGLPVIEELIL